MSMVASENVIVELRKRGRPPRDVQTILDAAVVIFAREGYSAATIEMIASEAAASTATLYKRFTNKHGLFAAVLEQTTAQALEFHLKNRVERHHVFAGMLNRLETHAVVCSDPQLRGVMRAWISEVRSSNELSDLFAVKSSEQMVAGLKNQLKKLQDAGYVELEGDFDVTSVIAAQMMLGIVERFTLMRGLILGDNIPQLFSATMVAEKAVQAIMGIWGTEKGLAALKAVPLIPMSTISPCK
jgi:AcrR family transcriptional regulator